MIRPIFSLALFLVACAVLAAPAPKPQPFVSGWEKPVDPDKDCTIKREKDTLIMDMPGRDHDYNPRRRQFNAPQLFREREIEGEFVMQVRVRIDGQPSAQSTVDGQPSSVSAGFLVMLPQKYPCVCIRVEFRATRKGSGVHGYFDVRRWFDDKRQGGSIVEGAKGPENEWKGDAYLRLERQDGNLGFAISSDGENWKRSGAIGGVREKLKVGLAAYSTSTDPSKVVFDQLTIRHGEQKRRPWEFVSGWGNPIDPDKDCKIKRDKDSLTIKMPGSDHDYDPVLKRFNAPRLISDLQGEFDVQVRVRIDSRPSAPSTIKGQPSFVSAGFLLIYPEPEYAICDRMECAFSQLRRGLDGDAVPVQLAEPRRKEPMPKGEEADHYAVMKTWVSARQRKGEPMEWDHARPVRSVNLLWERGWEKWPLSEKADYVYLRLEHRMVGYSYFYISPDGEKWTRLGHLRHMPAKGKVGLAAFSTSPEPSKVRFDQLKLARDKVKE
ncbi:MAG TPA: hypothetical protein VH575_09560 [Gemmataceae bacterium]|jgi:hypothetical protein